MRLAFLSVCLLGLLGCTVDSGGGNGGPRPPRPVTGSGGCAQVETFLRGCGLLGPGVFDCDEPDDAEEQCQQTCVTSASCSDVGQFVCTDFEDGAVPPNNAFVQCFLGCQALEEPDFVCDNGDEIPSSFLCDDFADCRNGEDEVGCESASDTFVCSDGTELPDFFECDGALDCVDGSDEANCGPTGPEAQPICN